MVRIHFELTGGLQTINNMTYYSFLPLYMFKQKFLDKKCQIICPWLSHMTLKAYRTRVRDQVASLCVIQQFSTRPISDIDIHVENIPKFMGWEPFVSVLLLQFQLHLLQAEDLPSWT